MHELSVISQVVESINSALKGKDFKRVASVRLEVGELTMLGREQLRFAWGILTEDGPARGSRLVIVRKPAVIECRRCGYRGGARHPSGLGSHMMMPLIACPRCGGEVAVVGGRDCVLKSMKLVLDEKTPKRKTRQGGGGKHARR